MVRKRFTNDKNDAAGATFFRFLSNVKLKVGYGGYICGLLNE